MNKTLEEGCKRIVEAVKKKPMTWRELRPIFYQASTERYYLLYIALQRLKRTDLLYAREGKFYLVKHPIGGTC